MKQLKFILVVLGVLALFYSCKQDKITPSNPSYNYFPTDYGRYVVYNADSTVHETSDNNNDDSISYYHFQLKDVLDSSFNDLEGKKRQVVLRYYRPADTVAWELRNVWSQLLTPSAAYRYEDNVAYHKLAFPINSTIQWNGNDRNTNGEEIYSYQGIHVSDNYNSLQFDSTINVLQIDETLFIGRTYGVEIYAENVGLIYKERDELSFNGVGQVSSGFEYKLTVIDYGPR